MVFKPDYGMSMIQQGYRPGLSLTWLELKAYNIDAVDTDKYCTTLELENIHAGHPVCCMTIDLNGERLAELLSVADPGTSKDVVRRLNSGERSIDLAEGIVFHAAGRTRPSNSGTT